MDRWVGRWIGRIDRCKCRWTDGWLGECEWMSGQVDELMNEKKKVIKSWARAMDGQTGSYMWIGW